MATDIQLTPTAGMPPVTTESQGSTATQGQTATQGATGVQQTPEAAAAEQALQQQQGQEAAAQEALGPALQKEAQIKSAGLELQGMQSTTDAERAARIQKAYAERIAAAESAARQAESERDNFTWPDFFGPKSSVQRAGKIAAGAIASFFGGFGGALVGQPNQALEFINKQLDRNLEEKKLALLNKENLAKWRRQGVTDLYGQMQHELANLEVEHGMLLNAAAKKAEAAALQAGADVETAKNNVLAQGLRTKAAETRQGATQRYEQNLSRQQQQNAETAQKTETQTTSAKGGTQAPIFNANGKAMGTTDAEEAKKANSELQFMRGTHDALNQLIDSYKQGTDLSDPAKALTVARQRQALIEDIKSSFPQVKGFTRLTAEDMKVFDQILGGKVDAFLATDSGRQLAEDALKRLTTSAEQAVRARGVQPDKNVLVRGAEDKEAPAAAPSVDKSQLKKQAQERIDWLKAHPKDPRAPGVRASLARINQALGAP